MVALLKIKTPNIFVFEKKSLQFVILQTLKFKMEKMKKICDQTSHFLCLYQS